MNTETIIIWPLIPWVESEDGADSDQECARLDAEVQRWVDAGKAFPPVEAST